jgi:hypothetical protein
MSRTKKGTPKAPEAAPESPGGLTGPRIPTEQLTGVNHIIFGSGSTSGPEVANSLGVNHNTLWMYLNRPGRGMPVAVADQLADDFCRRAAALLEQARHLRGLVARASREKAA